MTDDPTPTEATRPCAEVHHQHDGNPSTFDPLDAVLPRALRAWLADDPRRFVDISDESGVSAGTRNEILARLTAVQSGAGPTEVHSIADVLHGYGEGEQMWTSDVFWVLGHIERVVTAGMPIHLGWQAAIESGEFFESEAFYLELRLAVREIAAAVDELPSLPESVWPHAPKYDTSPVQKRPPGRKPSRKKD